MKHISRGAQRIKLERLLLLIATRYWPKAAWAVIRRVR